MAATIKKYDLDLARMEDEPLVVLAQECDYRPAANELLRRHHPRMGRLIAYQARQTPLTAHDVEDAQQNAVFALVEAIAGYNTLEMLKPRGCHFRTYARLVTMRRFWNFVKHIRRLQKRYYSCAELDGGRPGAWPGPSGAKPRNSTTCPGSTNLAPATVAMSPLRPQVRGDPAEAAARQEALDRLSQALQRLEENKQALWQALAAGKKLRQIACEQGISYDAVKRQRRQLLAHLSAAVGTRNPFTRRAYPHGKLGGLAFFLPRFGAGGEQER